MSYQDAQDRKDKAEELCRYRCSALDARDGLLERWAANARYYRNEASREDALIEEKQPYHVPLMQPLIDRLAQGRYLSITSAKPYVSVICDDPEGEESADRREADLHMLAERSGWRQSLWLRLLQAGLCGIAFKRTTFDEETASFVHETAHPERMWVHPTVHWRLDDVTVIGCDMVRTRAEVQRGVDAEEYYDVPLGAPATFGDRAPGGTESPRSSRDAASVSDADDPIDLFEACWRDGDEWWCATVAVQSRECLRIGRLLEGRSGWSDVRFHIEDAQFWPEGSPAQNLQQLQRLYNHLHSLFVFGSMSSAFKTLIATGGGMMDTQVVKLAAGPQIVPMQGPLEITDLGTTFDGQYVLSAIQQVERLANAAIRVTDQALGRETSGGTTATEVSQLAAQMDVNEGTYSSVVALGVESEWADFDALFKQNYDRIKKVYGDSIKSQPKDLAYPFRYEMSAKVGSSAPAVTLGKLQILHQMAQSQVSIYDPMKVEAAIGDALQLPVTVSKLYRDGVQQVLDDADGQGPLLGGDPLAGVLGDVGLPPIGQGEAGLEPVADEFGPESGLGFEDPGLDLYA